MPKANSGEGQESNPPNNLFIDQTDIVYNDRMGTTHSLIMQQIGKRLKNTKPALVHRPLPTVPQATKHTLVPNRNRLIMAAGQIFSIITRLKQQSDYQDLAQLRQHLLKELQKFQNQAEHSGYDLDSIMISRYSLSACLDEVIGNTRWGIKGNWKEHGLLRDLQPNISASERFFVILDTICRAPQKFIDTIEMMYICLNLGFEGKFRNQPYEKGRLRQVIDYTYNVIRKYRGEFDKYLSPSVPRYAATAKPRSSLTAVIFATCLIIASIYGSMNYLLRIYSDQATQQLQSITNVISKTD